MMSRSVTTSKVFGTGAEGAAREWAVMSHTTHSPLTDRTTSYDSVQDHNRIYLLLDRFKSRNLNWVGTPSQHQFECRVCRGARESFYSQNLKPVDQSPISIDVKVI